MQYIVQTYFCVSNHSGSTQPGHPSVGRRNEYQPKGGGAVRLGSKGRYGSCLVAFSVSAHPPGTHNGTHPRVCKSSRP